MASEPGLPAFTTKHARRLVPGLPPAPGDATVWQGYTIGRQSYAAHSALPVIRVRVPSPERQRRILTTLPRCYQRARLKAKDKTS